MSDSRHHCPKDGPPGEPEAPVRAGRPPGGERPCPGEAPALLSLIVPTYNERDNLRELLERIHRSLGSVRYEVLVVDDDSRDGTALLAEELGERFPVRVLLRKGKRGLASAILDGILATTGDPVCFLDADLSHPPERIPDMLRAVEEGRADLVVGSRWVKGGELARDYPRKRRWNSRVAGLITRPLTPVLDRMSGFMMFRRSVIRGVRLRPIGYKLGLEILVKGRHERVLELPILFSDRNRGRSKMGLRVTLEFLVHVARLYGQTLLLKLTHRLPR